ncbi:LptE family protein [Kiritimatiellaeota bacterium B1221]|nr:LptE family protein [Kiritimatiellaeota bacterium B1221]
MRHFRFTPIVLVSSLLLFSGCSGYKLGSQLPKDISSVYVPTVRNQTDEPLLENEATRAILEQIQSDGSLKIVSENEADAILYATLTTYEIEALSYDSDNRSTPSEYRLRLGARIEMVRTDNGQVLVRNSSLQGRDDFPLVGDLTSAKQNGLPGAAEDLARYIVAAVTEAWPD